MTARTSVRTELGLRPIHYSSRSTASIARARSCSKDPDEANPKPDRLDSNDPFVTFPNHLRLSKKTPPGHDNPQSAPFANLTARTNGALQKPRRSRIRRLLLGIGVVAGFFLLWLFAAWPPPIWYRWYWPRETAFMALREDQADSLLRHRQSRSLMVDGKLPRRYRPVPLAQIDPKVVQAVLVAEDRRFFEHGGIDYLAILTALGYRYDEFQWGRPRDRQELYQAIDRAWERRDRIRGASTITQQLAKNLYLSPSRNPLRKVKEAVTAFRLELAIPKSRLLELYLNVVEFGPEIWGVSAAADVYFGRTADDLSSEQAAALAGTLPFPLRSNPGFRSRRMERRKTLILRRMRGDPIAIPEDFHESIDESFDSEDDR